MAPSPANICILLFGNAARGDDALGEHMHTQLQQEIAAHPDQYDNIRLILDFQLAPEHIFDLHDADIGIFVDAHQDVATGTQWHSIEAGTQLHFTSHHLPPESLLFLFQNTFGKPAPPCYLLSMGGHSFELGAEISQDARLNLAHAFTLLQEKLTTLRTPLQSLHD